MYFKTKQFKDKSWPPFISRSRAVSVDWKKGISRSWLIHPWDGIDYIIQKFVTCEGRFNIVYLYHIKLMQHLKNDREINMPYFLLQRISNMAKFVKKQERNIEKSLYHYGFIKMTIKHQLRNQDLSWQQFVIENGFETMEEKIKEREILMITNTKEDVQESNETSSKQSMGRIITRSMMKVEK